MQSVLGWLGGWGMTMAILACLRQVSLAAVLILSFFSFSLYFLGRDLHFSSICARLSTASCGHSSNSRPLTLLFLALPCATARGKTTYLALNGQSD